MSSMTLKKPWALLLGITLICLLPLFGSGCAGLGKNFQILTSDDQQWTIPAGTDFKATQKPLHNDLTDFKAAADLMVLHKGTYLKLEQEANSRAIKGARDAKKQGKIWTVIGSVLTLITAVAGKGIFDKVKKK